MENIILKRKLNELDICFPSKDCAKIKINENHWNNDCNNDTFRLKSATLKSTVLDWVSSEKCGPADVSMNELKPNLLAQGSHKNSSLKQRMIYNQTKTEELKILRTEQSLCAPKYEIINPFDILYEFQDLINQQKHQNKLAFLHLISLRSYIEKAKEVDKLLRNNLKDKLLYKNKVGISIQKSMDQLKDLIETNCRKWEELQSYREATYHKSKYGLQEIINLKQQEEEVRSKIECLRKKKQEVKKLSSLFQDNSSNKMMNERVKLFCLKVDNIKELNEKYFREYTYVRILNEQFFQIKGGAKSICLLYPKNKNPEDLDYQNYIKLSKNQKILQLLANDKILNDSIKSKTHSNRIKKNFELYRLLNQPLDELLVSPEELRIIDETHLYQNMYYYSENSTGGCYPSSIYNSCNSNYQSQNCMTMETIENRLLDTMALNTFLILNPTIKANPEYGLWEEPKETNEKTDLTCRFDAILTNTHMIEYFDHDINKKLFYEIELFIKSSLYTSIHLIMKTLPYTNEQLVKIFSLNRSKQHYNLKAVRHLISDDRDCFPQENTCEPPGGQEHNIHGVQNTLCIKTNPASLKDFSPEVQKLFFEMYGRKLAYKKQKNQSVIIFFFHTSQQ